MKLSEPTDAYKQTVTADSGEMEKVDKDQRVVGEEMVVVDRPHDDTSLTVFPDGGLRAWLVVFGAACTTFSTFGFVNAWGVFQAYYETHLLKDTSPSVIAWIGSMQYALVFFPAIIVGRLFDLGWLKIPFFIGTAGLVLATLLTAQCTTFWQFVLAQGVLVGVSSGMCFGPVVGVLGHWFQKRRGLAFSITTVGASVGGTTIPIVARLLIPKVGFPWTMRILGLILAVILGLANLTLRRRIPPKDLPGGLLNIKALKSPAFTVYCFSTFAAFLGVYTLLTFIDISATAVGIPEDFSFYLVSIANACSGAGRLMSGLLVDRTGAINIMVPMTVVAALVTYLWPLAHSESSLIVVASIYGFTSATYVSMFQLPSYELGELEDVGRRSGMVMMFSAFGALAGPPISGAISQTSGGFTSVGFYAGSLMLLSCILMLVTRHLILRRLLGKF